MATPRERAAAFSGHRFRDVYAASSDDVRWIAVGEGVVTGRQPVIDACESTLVDLATTTVHFSRFVVVADVEGTAAAVAVVARYVGADGTTSVVSSCDIYEFDDRLVTTITSYAVELGPAAQN